MLKRFFTAAIDSKTSLSPAQRQPAPLLRPKPVELDLSLIRDGRITRTPAVEMTVDEFSLDHGVRTSVQPNVNPSTRKSSLLARLSGFSSNCRDDSHLKRWELVHS